ncbi:MAG TPA: hypothetical protein VF824_01175 [Thermoanaerobaculia bacterium]|jgi:dienelactone hydrolase
MRRATILLLAAFCFSSCTTLRCVFMTHHSKAAGGHHEAAPQDAWEDDQPVDGMKVYVKGNPDDPPILLLHELPGLLPQTVAFADEIVKRHYRVYMPLLFGGFGREAPLARQLLLCAGPNFNCLSTHESRVAGKLRVLRDRIYARHHRELGVIGMCLTGAMPLALADDKVAAVVLSQPAIPFPLTAATRRALGVDPKVLPVTHAQVLRIRFEQDCLVPQERFDAIAAVVPKDHLETIVVPTNDPRQHSVLTVEAGGAEARKAVDQALDFLGEHVRR